MRPRLRRMVERVEQRLGRVLVRAVAGVDDRAIDLAGQEMHRARVMVPHHQNVGPHGVQRHGGVDQRLALFDARRPDRHVHHVRAKPLSRKLERRLGAGRRLEEQIDLGAPAQGRRASSRPAARSSPLRRRDRATPRSPRATGARCRADGAGRRRAGGAETASGSEPIGAEVKPRQWGGDSPPRASPAWPGRGGRRNICRGSAGTGRRPARPRANRVMDERNFISSIGPKIRARFCPEHRAPASRTP